MEPWSLPPITTLPSSPNSTCFGKFFFASPVENIRIYSPFSSLCKSKPSATLSTTNWFFRNETAALPLLQISDAREHDDIRAYSSFPVSRVAMIFPSSPLRVWLVKRLESTAGGVRECAHLPIVNAEYVNISGSIVDKGDPPWHHYA